MEIAGDWMFVLPQNSYVETNLIPNVMVFEGRDFGKWLGDKDGAFLNEISALIRKTPESSFASSAMWRHSEKTIIY